MKRKKSFWRNWCDTNCHYRKYGVVIFVGCTRWSSGTASNVFALLKITGQFTGENKGRAMRWEISGTIKSYWNLTVYFHQFQEWKPHFHNDNNNLVQTKPLPIFHQTYIYDLHEQPEFWKFFYGFSFFKIFTWCALQIKLRLLISIKSSVTDFPKSHPAPRGDVSQVSRKGFYFTLSNW